MTDLIIACVRTGPLYPFHYVTKLRNMLARYMSLPYTLVCLTDQPERCEATTFIDVAGAGLPGWWAKMLLFEPTWRGRSQIIYFDLDTVIAGNVAPLTDVATEFTILESPVRRAGQKEYPCTYNSSCMVISPGRCAFMWERFEKRRSPMMLRHDRYGDQAAIEELYPGAPFLQGLLPGFFLNYRELTMQQPDGAVVVNFGGRHRPHNCPIPWVQQAWV